MKQQRLLKKISAETLETINRISTDELETHGIIQSARASGYFCPLCNSGAGSHGTGKSQSRDSYFLALFRLWDVFQPFAVVRYSFRAGSKNRLSNASRENLR